MFKPTSILLLCMLANIASASAQEAENALKEFEGKVLIFRHPLRDDSLRYSAEGKVLKGGPEESWTTHGVLLIDRIELTPEKISIAGRRIFILFGKNGLILLEFKRLKGSGSSPLSPSIKTEISLDQPVNSAEQARAILSRVFALNTAGLFDSLPDFWRRYLAGHLRYDSSLKQDEEFYWNYKLEERLIPVQSIEPTAKSGPADEEAESPVFHVGKDDKVKAPEARFTPGPTYSEIAQYEKYRGIVLVSIVVASDGRVHNVRLLRALGMGLDEIARDTVQTWRFRPATHNKEPVAVEMNIEVAFNIY
ncbi:MAG TPA: energy transducer TonB [Candidatus Angelobacter sp.]|jgi:TonB family protein